MHTYMIYHIVCSAQIEAPYLHVKSTMACMLKHVYVPSKRIAYVHVWCRTLCTAYLLGCFAHHLWTRSLPTSISRHRNDCSCVCRLDVIMWLSSSVLMILVHIQHVWCCRGVDMKSEKHTSSLEGHQKRSRT